MIARGWRNFLLENARHAAYIGLLDADMGRYF